MSEEVIEGLGMGELGVWLGGMLGLEEVRVVRADGFGRLGWEVGGVRVLRREGGG